MMILASVRSTPPDWLCFTSFITNFPESFTGAWYLITSVSQGAVCASTTLGRNPQKYGFELILMVARVLPEKWDLVTVFADRSIPTQSCTRGASSDAASLANKSRPLALLSPKSAVMSKWLSAAASASACRPGFDASSPLSAVISTTFCTP